MSWAKRGFVVMASVAMLGCGHTPGFDAQESSVGPFNGGADLRLTLNANQDYWPAWTEDGAGILYSYVDNVPGPQHRCLGLIPAAGGTRSWSLCDNRSTQTDSVNSFTAYALGNDGRLLYVEAVSRTGAQSTSPGATKLWLADSAAPFTRRALLSLPTFASGIPVSWLADIQWTGPTSFIALAQDFSILGHCLNCGPVDSIFYGQAVVRGTIGDGTTTLQAVAGTEGATGFSFAESGASIVFIKRDDRRLYKVAAAGGTATVAGIVTPNGAAQLLGVSCRASTCVVAASSVTLSAVTATGVTFPGVGAGPNELRAVSLVTGVSQVVRGTPTIVATPRISPVTGDVVAQLGGLFGHLQSSTNAGSDLHLYLGLVP